MISETQSAFVWAFLPGDTTPTLCARLTVEQTAAGQQVTSFIYGRSYLANPSALALDPIRLPLIDKQFRTTSQPGATPDVFGVIGDALPDSWGQHVIKRRYGEQRFPMGYLLKSQEDRVGHLCFSEEPDRLPQLTEPTSRGLLDEAWAVIAGLEAGKEIPQELEDRIQPNTAMGGARPKLTVADDRAQWLAKFPSKQDDRRYSQERAEAAMLDLARLCNIEAAEAELHEVPSAAGAPGGVVLLVRRFDRSRTPDGKAWLRDAYVSARTALQSDDGIRLFQFMGSYTQLAIQLQRWSVRPAADRRELFRRLAFNCCVSNTDDHDRNHGLLADESGHLFRLAPAFDIVPRIHLNRLRQQAMNIGDDGAFATVSNLLSCAPEFQLDLADASSIFEEIQTVVQEEWKNCLKNRGMGPSETAILQVCFAPIPK